MFNRTKVLKKLITKETPVILDIGANVGQSLAEFRSIWPESIVHCFEPQIECWNQWYEVQKSHPQKSSILNKIAVSNENLESKDFYFHDVEDLKSEGLARQTGISGFNKINDKSDDSVLLNSFSKASGDDLNIYLQGINKHRAVKTIRMDKYLESSNLKQIDLVKIDTQGHEVEVLDGFGERLEDVKVIITELMLFDYYEKKLNISDIEKFLIKYGFELYDISKISKNPMNYRTDWVDLIYKKH